MSEAVTSLLAWTELIARPEELGRRQADVFAVIMNEGAINNRLIAQKLGLPINSVTPRVHELRERGLVVQAGVWKDPDTERDTIWWSTV